MKTPRSPWIAATLICSLAFSPLARADVSADPSPTATEQAVTDTAQAPSPDLEVESPYAPYGDLKETYEDDNDDDEEPQGTSVSTTSNAEEKARKKQFWTNIILAGAAVIVAVVSILVVSNNNGKSP